MQIRPLTMPFDANADAELLGDALGHLKAGDLIGIPTETVYGLGADATKPRAVARIFEAKGRPRFNPLICHVESFEAARRHGVFTPLAERLAEAFWPGPLTLVVPRQPESPVCDLVTAGLDTLALRVPSAPATQWLCAQLGAPIAAPSANRSGRISTTRAGDVAADLGEAVPLILDAGPTRVGLESTIIAIDGETATLLRPGGISHAQAEEVIGAPLARPGPSSGNRPTAPGMLASHYAPSAPIRLHASHAAPGEALLAFGDTSEIQIGKDVFALNLSPAGDLIEAAANLFGHLRALDARNPACIAVTAIPQAGLGEAINDRLARAAAPRPG